MHQFLDSDERMNLKFTMDKNGIAQVLTMNGPNGKMVSKKL